MLLLRRSSPQQPQSLLSDRLESSEYSTSGTTVSALTTVIFIVPTIAATRRFLMASDKAGRRLVL